MANDKVYGNYLMHYRTKGSKNGFSKYPWYTPIGEKAKGIITAPNMVANTVRRGMGAALGSSSAARYNTGVIGRSRGGTQSSSIHPRVSLPYEEAHKAYQRQEQKDRETQESLNKYREAMARIGNAQNSPSYEERYNKNRATAEAKARLREGVYKNSTAGARESLVKSIQNYGENLARDRSRRIAAGSQIASKALAGGIQSSRSKGNASLNSSNAARYAGERQASVNKRRADTQTARQTEEYYRTGGNRKIGRPTTGSDLIGRAGYTSSGDRMYISNEPRRIANIGAKTARRANRDADAIRSYDVENTRAAGVGIGNEGWDEIRRQKKLFDGLKRSGKKFKDDVRRAKRNRSR
jgi:hypothetical protein